MRLLKSSIDKIESPTQSAQAFYRDDQLKGFAIRVTSNGIKSFIIEKLIEGKVRRITLGRYGELTVEQARKEAQKLLGKIATGIDPLAEKKAAEARRITLKEVFQDYLKTRKDLKPKTLSDYIRTVRNAFPDWQNKPLHFITKDKIAKRHNLLGQERGPAYANLAMRILRALFNFAAGQYEDAKGHSLVTENPVKRLSQTRAWYRIKRRQTFIKVDDLAAWYNSVMALNNITLRDYLLLIVFTGLRKQEAAQLKWSNINFTMKKLTLEDTKNNQSHTLPLTSFLQNLLQHRQQTVTSEYVFPGTGKEGYIVEPRKQMAKVIQRSGILFTIHDLRRTFITVAESLDISAYALKRLMNHKMNNDVTAGYIINDVERLRKPMQQVTDYLIQCMKIKEISTNGNHFDSLIPVESIVTEPHIANNDNNR